MVSSTMLENKISVMQNCKIGVLIGYNCSLAIKPPGIISGRDKEPYGVQMHLWWSIVGPLLIFVQLHLIGSKAITG